MHGRRYNLKDQRRREATGRKGFKNKLLVVGDNTMTVGNYLFIYYLFISFLHRSSQRKAIIKGECELDVEKSFSVCVNVHELL